MKLSDNEIKKITEIVAGKMGSEIDAKQMRRVLDRVIDKLKENPSNPEITGATCEVSSSQTTQRQTGLSGKEPLHLNQRDPEDRPGTGQREPMQINRQMNLHQQQSSQKPVNLDSYDDSDDSQAGLYQQIEQTDKSRVIIATFGKNRPGVVAAITDILAKNNCSIEDISQTLMQEFFSMIMVVDISGTSVDFENLRTQLKATESQLGMKVYVMHEDIFRYMHRI